MFHTKISGGFLMRVAISTDGNNVAQHFGRCPSYTIVDIDDNKVVGTQIVDNPGHTPGAIPQMMNELGVDVMIAGGMGARAVNFFQEYGIQTALTSNILDTFVNPDVRK
jgi:predicted Fe-Mo cluster-binding NifX family protein